MTREKLKGTIESAWEDRSLTGEKDVKNAVLETIGLLDSGELRIAEAVGEDWVVNEWAKKAVLLYFGIQKMVVEKTGPFEFHDMVPLKSGYKEKGVRVVPDACARYGCYLAPGVILMPSYVNIGAYVDENTMVDNYTLVGSCAQLGKNIHLSAGVIIGGVLEPPQATPVIIEDNCFVGAKASIVEGIVVKKEAVIASNVNLTASTKIIDVSGEEPVEYYGYVPPRSVVIPGSYTKKFPAGDYQVQCALIIGKRKESTNKKTSLNQVLRDFNVEV
jgi:2,3,4,5-tetrahydropyridine-2,6-dicarboxylate N-succinyltransferase